MSKDRLKALVIGATGAVGKDLVQQLMEDSSVERVDIFVRREVKIPSAKLVAHVVDFDHPETWAEQLQGDVLFSCMGTTIKAAGPQVPDSFIAWFYCGLGPGLLSAGIRFILRWWKAIH